MHASFPRTLGVVGLLAISLTGCQTASLGKFSWNPKNWKFGKKPDTALASNTTAPAATTAGSTADPWQPTLPSSTATPGYGAPAGNNSYAAASNQYSTAYPVAPTNYAADAGQSGWGTTPPTQDPNAYAANPAAPQAGPYVDYSQPQPQTGYGPSPAYGATNVPAQQPAAGWDPATQYGPAPSMPQQAQYGAPAAHLADNTQYPAATQYDGTQQPAATTQQNYAPQQPAYGAQPQYSTGSGYDAAGYPAPQDPWPPAQQQGTQTNPQYQPSTGTTPQPYRPGGTSNYTPPSQSGVVPAGYDPTYSGAPSYTPTP
jgi:hypothetical protein